MAVPAPCQPELMILICRHPPSLPVAQPRRPPRRLALRPRRLVAQSRRLPSPPLPAEASGTAPPGQDSWVSRDTSITLLSPQVGRPGLVSLDGKLLTLLCTDYRPIHQPPRLPARRVCRRYVPFSSFQQPACACEVTMRLTVCLLLQTMAGTQLVSLLTQRPLPVTVSLRSSTPGGRCLEPSVRFCDGCPQAPTLLKSAFHKH